MNILKLLTFFLMITLCFNCNEEKEEPEMICDLSSVNEGYKNITPEMNFQEVRDLIQETATGTTFASSNIATTTWLYCNNTDLFINVVADISKLYSKVKSFADDSCSEEINIENFDLIEIGDSYQKLVNLFQDYGDNFQTSYVYEPTDEIRETFTWYDCANTDLRIQVTFVNQVVVEKLENL